MTTATLLDRVPLDEITDLSRKARPGRVVLSALAGVLFAAGWCVAKAFAVGWLAGAWCFTAVRVGWLTAQGKPVPSGPSYTELAEENAKLRLELRRLQ